MPARLKVLMTELSRSGFLERSLGGRFFRGASELRTELPHERWRTRMNSSLNLSLNAAHRRCRRGRSRFNVDRAAWGGKVTFRVSAGAARPGLRRALLSPPPLLNQRIK